VSDRWTITARWLLILGMLATSASVLAEQDPALRDPTMPDGWRAPAASKDPERAPTLRLHGTFSVAGSRSALIDGQRVGVGDEIAGATVLRIEKNSVILRIGGQTVVLASLAAAPVKTPVDQAEDKK
jgi:hypothetical protein